MGSLVSLNAMVQFDIASHLPKSGGISVAALAKSCGMHPSDLDMIVRHGLTRRLFLLHPDGTVGHSVFSKAILDVPNLQNYIAGIGGNMPPAIPHILSVMEQWPGSQEEEESAYKLAYGSPFWKDLEANPQKAREFAGAMTFLQGNPAIETRFVHEYDWAQHATGTVVDVGGSQGEVAFELAKKYPDMKIVVQDRREVVALASMDKPGNVEFQAHDFFEEQPFKGADVYFFRWIMHDWSAKYCVKILQALRPAMKNGARVVLMETILPGPGVLTPYQERMIRNYDIVMKVLFNAKERTEEDWREIIADADDEGRFSVVDVLRPTGSQLGFMVIEWTG